MAEKGGLQVRRLSAVLVATVVLAALCAGCGESSTASSGRAVGAGVTISSSRLPRHAVAVVSTAPAPAVGGDLRVLSSVFELTPAGALPSPARVTIPLRSPVPSDEVVVVASKETPTGRWTYLPAELQGHRDSVTFTATRFSWWTVLGYPLAQLVSAFKTQFLDQVDGGATASATQPSCPTHRAAAAAGYTVQVSAEAPTLLWCLGMAHTAAQLVVVNNRRYPLEILHPGMSVVAASPIDYGQLSSLSHLGSGAYTIVAPTSEATFVGAFPPGHGGGVETQMDGLGQSLYALQTGVTTLVEILTEFRASSGESATDAVGTLLSADACADSLGHGPAAMLASCFSPGQLSDALGAGAALLNPLIAVGPLAAFFTSEFQALIDQFNGHDRETIEVIRSGRVPQDLSGSGQAYWSPPDLIAPGAGSGLGGISCPTVSFCVAVGQEAQGAVALTYSNGIWSGPEVVDPTAGAALTSVSCPTARFCAAVGQAGYGAITLTYTDGTWSRPDVVDPAGGPHLLSVSCATATFCMAVGVSSGGGPGVTLTYTHGVWSRPDVIDQGSAASLYSVACPTPNFCGAVGQEENGGGGVAQTYAQGLWSRPDVIASTRDEELASVSCPTASFCMAIGGTFGQTVALEYAADRWSAPDVIAHNGTFAAFPISCSTVASCMAIGLFDDPGEAVTLTYADGAWAQPKSFRYLAGNGLVPSISCPTTSFCIAVGEQGPETGGVAFTYSRGSGG